MRALVLGFGLEVLLAGCKGSGGTPKQTKTFHVRGKIVEVNAANGSVTLDGGEIPGYMEAMTMDYKLAQPNVISELHPGDTITAAVLVECQLVRALMLAAPQQVVLLLLRSITK